MIYDSIITGEIDQGDILYPIKVDNLVNWWKDDEDYPIIILTPTCDIAQEKVDHHRFAVLQPFPFLYLKICQDICGDESMDLNNLSITKKGQIKNKLSQAIKNSWPRYHFLPQEGVVKTTRIIDFEIIFSVPLNTFSPNLKVARLNSPYREELIHRYSHHTMRIGTEGLSNDKIEQIISNCFLLNGNK